jgi:hypothetical protein
MRATKYEDSPLVVVTNSLHDLRGAFGGMAPEGGGGAGMAQGYNTEGDVLTQTIDGRPLNEVWQELQQALLAWNAGRDLLVSALTFNVNTPIEEVPQLSLADFEEASEYGEPVGIRGGDYFSMGYTFKWYDIAVRFTWKYLAEATAAQVETLGNQVLEADNRLIFNAVMKQIFNNVNQVANIRGNNYNVYPFYNNDGTVPPQYKNNTFTSTHQHYVTSGAATVDSGDLDQMELLLKEHGYGRQAGSTMILLVNPVQLTTIRSFRVATGSAYDFVANSGQPPWLLPAVTGGIVIPQGTPMPGTVNGLTVVGRYGSWLIVEEDYIPVGYMVGFATGGELNATNPVGIREHQNASLRGLRLVKGREPDYPLIDSFYNRGFGTGVRHRGAGVVMQVTAAGAYTIPAAYV